MRNNEKIMNEAEDRRSINKPVIISAAAVVLLIACLVWFGIKNPNVFSGIRDMILTVSVLVLFLINTVIAVLCFLLTSKLGEARKTIDKYLTTADGKIEELAEKVTEVFRAILNPFIEIQAGSSSIKSLFTKWKTEN